ncbi:MAG: hypothetical protein ACOCXY_00930 [Planctomycetota bacterium]
MAVEQTSKPRASGLWYLVAVLLIVGGIAYGGYLAAQAVMGSVESFTEGDGEIIQKVGVPVPVTDEVVTLPQPGEYIVYVAFEGNEDLDNEDPALKKLARDVYVAVKPTEPSGSVSMSPISVNMTYQMNNKVGFGVFSLDSGDANQVTMTTALNADELSGDAASAMGRVDNVQIVVARFNDGGLVGNLQSAGLVAGGGIVLGIVVIIITAVRRSRSSGAVADPYQNSPAGQSPPRIPEQGPPPAPPRQQ